MKPAEMGSACGKHGQKRMASKVLVGKLGRKNFET
jgi:hypothetical protein